VAAVLVAVVVEVEEWKLKEPEPEAEGAGAGPTPALLALKSGVPYSSALAAALPPVPAATEPPRPSLRRNGVSSNV
jgi:hypothetical protein